MANINIGQPPKKPVQNVSITDMVQPKAKPAIDVSAIKPKKSPTNIIDLARPVKKGSHIYASSKAKHYGRLYRRLGPISVLAGKSSDATRKMAEDRKSYYKNIRAENQRKLESQQ